MTNRQPSWNVHEAVVLQDTFVATEDGLLSREYAIKRVSSDLRKMALNNGVNVDQTFRNENGVTAFYQYLLTTLGMAEATCRSYTSAISSCEAFAREHNFAFWQLYTDEKSVAEETIRLLMEDEDFKKYNVEQHNRFSAALKKFFEYRMGETLSVCSSKK